MRFIALIIALIACSACTANKSDGDRTTIQASQTLEDQTKRNAKSKTESQESKTRIVILGDSITAGYGISKEQAFPFIVENSLNKKGRNVEIVNAGQSGATSASGLSRLEWHLKKKPDILILELGGNDGLRSIDLETTKENLAKTIELAQKNDIRVILAGMKLPYNYPQSYREQFENVFKDLSEKYETGYIPFLLKGVGGEPEYNLPDLIHPNGKGHEKIAQTVIETIEKEL